MSLIDKPSHEKLLTPRERLEEAAKLNPSQVLCVTVFNDGKNVAVQTDFHSEKDMLKMLDVLESHLQKEIQLRRNKSKLDHVRKHGVKLT